MRNFVDSFEASDRGRVLAPVHVLVVEAIVDESMNVLVVDTLANATMESAVALFVLDTELVDSSTLPMETPCRIAKVVDRWCCSNRRAAASVERVRFGVGSLDPELSVRCHPLHGRLGRVVRDVSATDSKCLELALCLVRDALLNVRPTRCYGSGQISLLV